MTSFILNFLFQTLVWNFGVIFHISECAKKFENRPKVAILGRHVLMAAWAQRKKIMWRFELHFRQENHFFTLFWFAATQKSLFCLLCTPILRRSTCINSSTSGAPNSSKPSTEYGERFPHLISLLSICYSNTLASRISKKSFECYSVCFPKHSSFASFWHEKSWFCESFGTRRFPLRLCIDRTLF